MTPKEYEVYRYLEQVACDDPTRWVSKEELIAKFPQYFIKGEDSHDICSTLNLVRLRINEARAAGKVSHLVLLKDHHFKLCISREEAEEHINKDFNNAMKLLKRYWQNMGTIKEDGYGKLIDCNGNVITDESLAKTFQMPFDYNLKSESHNLDKQLDDLTVNLIQRKSQGKLIIQLVRNLDKCYKESIPICVAYTDKHDVVDIYDYGSSENAMYFNKTQNRETPIKWQILTALINGGVLQVIKDFR